MQFAMRLFSALDRREMLHWLPDKLYLHMEYRLCMGQRLNLANPKTFNEKLQWLKLYDRRPEYIKMVDKYEAKMYVAERLGEHYIIPTFGVWNRFDDIDFDALPERFVLKCTHDSGGLVICRDKSGLDKAAAKIKIEKCLRRNYYWHGREWPYKDVKPRIIAEQLMVDPIGEELVEYKTFCFNGSAKMILVCKGQAHGSGRTNDFCDIDLVRLPFTSLNPNSKGELEKPKELPEIIALSEQLAKGIPQARIDTYLVGHKVYFGEITLFHNSGFCSFEPPDWDKTIGSWILLPEKKM